MRGMRIGEFKLERFFDRYEFTAPYLLCTSDCESVGLDELLMLEPEAREGLSALRLGYIEAAGTPALRQAVADMYGTIAAEEVLLQAGSSEAIFSFMNCALTAGDHVVVQTPCYQSHYEVARALGCDVSSWTGDEENGWALDPDALRSLIRPATKALMLTVPHNPTGHLMPRSTQAAIVEIVRAHGLWLFSDEVFRFLEQDPALRLPPAADLYERAVSIGGLSKSFGLAGLRVGWAATRDHTLFQAMQRFKDYLSLCNGAPDELLAGIALKHRHTLHERNLQIISANLVVLEEFLARHPRLFSWHRLQASPVGLVRYAGPEGSARFCETLVAQSGLLLLPSAVLEFGDQHFRVGLGRRNAPECIARLDEFLCENMPA